MKNLLNAAKKNTKLSNAAIAHALNIDSALISKYLNGKRLPTHNQLLALSQILNLDYNELEKAWYKEKFIKELGYNKNAFRALLEVQEEKQNYIDAGNTKNSGGLQLFDEIDDLKAKLTSLRAYNSYRISQALELEYTYESNRIEGNTLTLRETDFVVNEGLTISGKSMREHLEAINHSEALEFIKDLVNNKIDLNKRILLQIHYLILKSIDLQNAGKFRNVQVIIKGSKHLPPQPYLVEKQMEDYFIWYEHNKYTMHPVELAANMHEKLVKIHPFIDGNGRTSRLVMNLILLKNGYVIANIHGDTNNKMKYFDALETVQIGQSKDAFIDYIAEVQKSCLLRILEILGGN